MSRITVTLVLLLLLPATSVWAQPAPGEHSKKVYINEDRKIFLPDGADIFLRLTLSPDDNSPSHLLLSKDALNKNADPEPFHFEGHGNHSILHPREGWNERNKKIPATTDVFVVTVDGKPPVTKVSVSEARHVVNNNRTVYGAPVNISLKTTDADSGVEDAFGAIDNIPFAPYQHAFSFDSDHNFTVSYYGVDNVGNAAKVVTKKYAIDLTPPVSSIVVKRYAVDDILSAKARIGLKASDKKAGVDEQFSYFDDGDFAKYKIGSPLSLKQLSEGEHRLTYYANDRVGNVESPITYPFYLDRTPPVANHEIQGDMYQGKRLYVSERSRIQLSATDNRAGVEALRYSLGGKKSGAYEGPFGLPSSGTHYVVGYFAIDRVENRGKTTKFKVTLDKTPPEAKLSFDGEHYFAREFHFVTSATNINLSFSDDWSGVQRFDIILDAIELPEDQASFQIEEEGEHNLIYSAQDNVNNRSVEYTATVFVDNTPPKIFFHFSVSSLSEPSSGSAGEYPLKTLLYLAATDKHAGVRSISYRVDSGSAKAYLDAIRLQEPGEHSVSVTSVDNVGNTSERNATFTVLDN